MIGCIYSIRQNRMKEVYEMFSIINHKQNNLMCCRMLYSRTCNMAEVSGCSSVRLKYDTMLVM